MAYDRPRAVQYAAHWWNSHNPAFRLFEDDCTNFISQCLWAGGMPMEGTGRRDRGWWYLGPHEQWSYSWTVANGLRWYLENSRRAQSREQARDLEIGDIVMYDWDGDGSWQHNTIIVGFNHEGEPLVSAHTINSFGRAWRYLDSPAYTSRTKYLFWHINLP